MSTLVYLDGAVENRTDALALHAVRIDGTWNGWLVPVVTAAEFRRFIAAWQANDPNGLWDADAVRVSDDGMLHMDDDDMPEAWSPVGTDEHDNALYALDGWVWTA